MLVRTTMVHVAVQHRGAGGVVRAPLAAAYLADS